MVLQSPIPPNPKELYKIALSLTTKNEPLNLGNAIKLWIPDPFEAAFNATGLNVDDVAKLFDGVSISSVNDKPLFSFNLLPLDAFVGSATIHTGISMDGEIKIGKNTAEILFDIDPSAKNTKSDPVFQAGFDIDIALFGIGRAWVKLQIYGTKVNIETKWGALPLT
jgi:hypothetical protein